MKRLFYIFLFFVSALGGFAQISHMNNALKLKLEKSGSEQFNLLVEGSPSKLLKAAENGSIQVHYYSGK